MVLVEWGKRISDALKKLMDTSIVSDKVINETIVEISNALIASDVNIELVIKLRADMANAIKNNIVGAAANKRQLIRKIVFDELCKFFGANTSTPYKPEKGKTNIIVFVGLQGSGKTTTVAKYAHYHKRRGFVPGLICADTYRAGAYDQLLQNCNEINVNFYGNRGENDPVKISLDGIEKLKSQKCDLIIVDTSGRHRQEKDLLKEMNNIVSFVKPDLVIFIMDASIGQMALDQAEAFKNAVQLGAIIITKVDGSAKGGGALSAVVKTNVPIIFLGTGEGFDKLEVFESTSFISKLLKLNDLKGFIEMIKNAVPQDENIKESAKRIQAGKFSLKDFYTNLEAMLKLGPLSQVMENIPMLGEMLRGNGEEGTKKIKIYIVIMDSINKKEMNNPKMLNEKSRLIRIARGSGRPLSEVNELMNFYKMFEKMMSSKIGRMKGHGGLQFGQQLSKFLPQSILNKIGSGEIKNIMKQAESIGGLGKPFRR